MNADSVGQHLIGDQAQTLQNAFQRIIPVIRRKRIALLCAAPGTGRNGFTNAKNA